MGWGYKSSNMGHKYGYPTYNSLIAIPEPQSTERIPAEGIPAASIVVPFLGYF